LPAGAGDPGRRTRRSFISPLWVHIKGVAAMLGNGRVWGFQVFLLAMSILMLEVALTRVFSFIMFHHFTYLVIGVAMLGFGAAGTYLTVRRTSPAAAQEQDFLAHNAWLFGLAAIVAMILIPRIHFFPLDMYHHQDYSNLLSLLLIIMLTALPFFFRGTCIAWIISRAGLSCGRCSRRSTGSERRNRTNLVGGQPLYPRRGGDRRPAPAARQASQP
jgi:hypothetical protein